jgi:microcin C transport system substrate-binding protein
MQAFAFNLRRSKFKDPRVRLAFNYAFDFEDLNRKIFYGQYKRINSYFWGTELAATALPTGRELELLETVRDKIPPEVFTKPYSNPVGGDAMAVRNNFREALRLLRESGYEVRHQKLVKSNTGEQFEVELLTNAPLFERVFLFCKRSLEHLGMAVSVRTVDAACASGISTLSHLPGVYRFCPEKSCEVIGAHWRRTRQDRKISSVSRIGRSMT